MRNSVFLVVVFVVTIFNTSFALAEIQQVNWQSANKKSAEKQSVYHQRSKKFDTDTKHHIPTLCQQRNKNEQAQRAACERQQQQLSKRVTEFLKHNRSPQEVMRFQRCQKRWDIRKHYSLNYLLRCLGSNDNSAATIRSNTSVFTCSRIATRLLSRVLTENKIEAVGRHSNSACGLI